MSRRNGLKDFAVHRVDGVELLSLLEESVVRYSVKSTHARAKAYLKTLWEQKLSPSRKDNFEQASIRSNSEKGLRYFQSEKSKKEVDFVETSSLHIGFTRTEIIKFRQNYYDIPVFGSGATVELDDKSGELLAISTSLAQDIDREPKDPIKEYEALEVIANEENCSLKDLSDLLQADLYYYYVKKDGEKESYEKKTSNSKRMGEWRLVYITSTRKKRENENDKTGHVGLKRGLVASEGEFDGPEFMDYVIDAHDRTLIAKLPRFRTLR